MYETKQISKLSTNVSCLVLLHLSLVQLSWQGRLFFSFIIEFKGIAGEVFLEKFLICLCLQYIFKNHPR